jgi:hypothetical protein
MKTYDHRRHLPASIWKLVAAAALLTCLLFAQEAVDSETYAKIRKEATEHSKVMQWAHMLTDRYGPRLTGSPNYEAAAKWAVATMTEWGLKNAHLEPWDFGHPGWMNQRASGYLVSPIRSRLTFEVLAWTPSTKGYVAGSVAQLILPQNPTKEEFTAWLEANRAKVKGKIVLLGKAAALSVNFNPPANKRMTDEQARNRFGPLAGPAAARAGPEFPQRAPQAQPGRLSARQIDELITPWLVTNGALVRINDAGREFGQIRAFNNRSFDVAKAVPTVVLRNEDYGRIERLLNDGTEVRAQFNILNQVYPKGKTTYNVVAEIPGTDKADEVVMLGAHLDSWHAATGATDNATGCSVMMEAARLIQALGLKPRRTIRVALWSAEEEGLLGSQAYVKEHFGTFEEPKPDFAKLVAYFNLDSGTGRPRGASVFGPPEAAGVLRAALAPFQDLGVAGARAAAGRNLGGTDSTSFNAAGLAGINLGQDPIEYMSNTWHTNLDTYERVVPDDLVKASIVVAAAVWHLANRAEMLPRFTKETMPAPPRPERATPAVPPSPPAAKPPAAKR